MSLEDFEIRKRQSPLSGLGDFSPQADAYQKARPGYPSELVTQLIQKFRLSPGDSVADLGAGTGLLTEHLSQFGFEVTAIEPSLEMRDNAPSLANTRWIDATFDQTTLDSNSQSWVVAAQAFHWADPQVALPEIKRILKADRPLTCIWNNRRNDECEALSWVMEAITRYVPDFNHHYRKADWEKTLVSTGHFKEVIYHGVDHSIPMSKDRFKDLWKSHNRLNTQAGPKTMEKLLNELTGFLNSKYPGDVEVPYRCDAWSVV